MKIGPDEIESAKSAKGGWTRSTLAKWGVPWPPPKGWRRALEEGKPIKRSRRFWKTAEGQAILKARRAEADWARLETWE